MAAARDFSRRSWRLKLARAEHHMKELEAEIARYVGRHPYEARRLDQGDPDAQPWRWVLYITEQPPDHIAIVLGDVLMNLRASLDHIFAVLVPGRPKNNFPLITDPSEKGRERFDSAVKGAPPDAITILESLQPYHVPPLSPTGTPQIHAIRELNRLVQADKHSELIRIRTSLAHAWSLAFLVSNVDGVRRGGVVNRGWYTDLADEGAVIADFGFNPADVPPGSEVQVHIHGTPRVSVKIVDEYGNNELLGLLRLVLDFLATDVFPSLEEHIPV